jgi:hypothetical protein
MNKTNLFKTTIAGLVLGTTLTACSSAVDDNDDIPINYVEDEECCSLDEEEQTLLYIRNLKEIPLESNLDVDRFRVKLYTDGSDLHAGYNEVYFTVEKPVTGRHVKDVEFYDITPLMTMGKMNNMQHSTPVGTPKRITSWIPVFRTWVAFLMPTDVENQNSWELNFGYRIQEQEGSFSIPNLVVAAQSEGTVTLKSFKVGDKTYFATLANSGSLKTGINSVTAYVSEKADPITNAYPAAEQKFTIEVAPTMPDMGNHTSPDNVPLTYNESKGAYTGSINLTMTGQWNIHLVVKDEEGNIVAGDTNDDSGYSNLYWSVSI